ncbi:Crp/Fnr family transcriptional regulator [Rhodobacter maris]|uniref:CRP-like cAMP-binding protein n=1 Tax=Rhodobacter maris TaxID=446682 RepID=A0A285T6N9_9RHOB|nr:Crp/Fnr family transcriptional regulator [Rhodobacter maris]SOC17006.1 CRP-like cAMP-binding protein [Rhodobacter maris]
MTPDADRIARKSLLLGALPKPAQDLILATARDRAFERGKTIFLQGEQARSIYVVAEGWVKLYRVAPNGSEAVVSVFTRGDSFGEAVAFAGGVYPVSAEAATDAVLVRIETAEILRLIERQPGLAEALLAASFAHLHRLVGQIEQLKARSGAQRVAEFLLEHVPEESGGCAVTLPYDKVLIAGRLGMKPESLSRAFARLREKGVQVRQSRAEIADVAVLRAYVEEDPGLSWSR